MPASQENHKAVDKHENETVQADQPATENPQSTVYYGVDMMGLFQGTEEERKAVYERSISALHDDINDRHLSAMLGQVTVSNDEAPTSATTATNVATDSDAATTVSEADTAVSESTMNSQDTVMSDVGPLIPQNDGTDDDRGKARQEKSLIERIKARHEELVAGADKLTASKSKGVKPGNEQYSMIMINQETIRLRASKDSKTKAKLDEEISEWKVEFVDDYAKHLQRFLANKDSTVIVDKGKKKAATDEAGPAPAKKKGKNVHFPAQVGRCLTQFFNLRSIDQAEFDSLFLDWAHDNDVYDYPLPVPGKEKPAKPNKKPAADSDSEDAVGGGPSTPKTGIIKEEEDAELC